MSQKRFWADPNVEPKRGYRFVMRINNIPAWIVKKVSKPNFTIEETAHQYLNHEFKYPSKVKWDKISVTLVDPVYPDASKTMMDIINRSGYHFPENPHDVTTVSKAKAISALGNVSIEQIGPDGDEPIEKWGLVNAWVSSVKFGELDYSANEMTEVTLEIVYDYAIISTKGQSALM